MNQSDVNSVMLLVLAVSTIAAQVYFNIKNNTKMMVSDQDKLRTAIIADYETRLKQVEGDVVTLRKENANLNDQLKNVRDLPLKQMADSLTIIVKSLATITETQQHIITTINEQHKVVSITNNAGM